MRLEIANWVGALRPRWRRFKGGPKGVMYHTWGRTIVEKANAKGQKPIDRALRFHRRRAGVHFSIESDGTIYQILDTDIRGAHCGVSRAQRRRYLSGIWQQDMVQEGRLLALNLWRERWGMYRGAGAGYKSPQHIYEGKSPNDDYIGVEMEPLLEANADGTWFTCAQHSSARRLWEVLRFAYGWPYPCAMQISGKRGFPSAVGHGDITPHSRWDRKGSWDPGAMRDVPRFDWSRVLR